MAAGSYVGTTSYLTFSEEPLENSEGVDTLRIVRRGDRTDYNTEFDGWTRGKVASSLGYPNMYLQQKRAIKGGGSNFCTIELDFAGFLSTTLANPIGTSDSMVLQSSTFVSDENDPDGNAQNVQASFYAQQTTVRWIYRGAGAPTTPRYPSIVPSTVPTGILFNEYPASYTGTLQTKNVGRLAQFDREELATGVWGVIETWVNRIEPDS